MDSKKKKNHQSLFVCFLFSSAQRFDGVQSPDPSPLLRGPADRWSHGHVFSFWQLLTRQHRPWWRTDGQWTLTSIRGVRMGGYGKIPWLSSQCQNTTRGVAWCSRAGGAWDEGGGGGLCVQFSPSFARPAQASMGLDTMLFGVSGSWDDMDATSLPVELEPGPPSEKLTCEGRGGGTHTGEWIGQTHLDAPLWQLEADGYGHRHRPGSRAAPHRALLDPPPKSTLNLDQRFIYGDYWYLL